MYILCIDFFFFKQKTAYEMRISDWSSDVCSSDLTSGVGLLALWAAANARSRDGWMIAAALGFGALGDWLLDAVGMMPGAAAFAVGHLIDRKSTRLNSSH